MSLGALGKTRLAGIMPIRPGDMFPDEETARRWFERRVWPDGRRCPRCGSTRTHACRHKTSPYRCTDCRKYFSVKTGTAMERSKIPLRQWAIAICLEGASTRGATSMQLHRDLGVTQTTAWFMLRRLREARARGDETLPADAGGAACSGPDNHGSTSRRVSEYTEGVAHAASIESFWSMLKQDCQKERSGMNARYQQRREHDLAGHRVRDTSARMQLVISGLEDRTFPVSTIPAVNVAEVPKRSPLRYPGGKTWLIPHIRQWLTATADQVPHPLLIEPFVGGGIVSLTAVMEGLASRALMVDLDHDVAAFWRAAIDCGEGLMARVREFQPTRERITCIAQAAPQNVLEHGFRTLVLNRTRRGGILAPGASLTRAGEKGKGVRSRWYPETLCKRLAEIRRHRDNLAFFEGDGLALSEKLAQRDDTCFFIDPPYTASGGKRAGRRLYAHNVVEHQRLFEIMADHGCNFLMTSDCSDEVVQCVRRYHFHAVTVMMKNTHHARMPELVITRTRLFT